MNSNYLNRYENGSQNSNAAAARSTELKEDTWGDYESLLEDNSVWEDSPDPFLNSDMSEGTSYTAKPLSKKEALKLIREHATELRKNKDLSALEGLEELANSISRSSGQELSPNLTAAVLTKTGAAPADSEDFDLEGFFGSEGSEGASLSSLRSELNQLKSSIESNSDLPSDQKEGRLEKINKWLLALDLKPSEESLMTIQDGMESLKLGEDIAGDYGDMEDDGGDSPTRVKDGIRYFESKSSQGFSFIPLGKGTENVVSTGGEITITPQDPNTPVSITEEGGYTVIKVQGEKEDIYKIRGNDSKIQIDSEKVTGDFKNEDDRVTVGGKQKKYISQNTFSDAADKLRGGADKVGGNFEDRITNGVMGPTISSNQFGGLEGNQQYSADTEQKNKDVKEVLGTMAEAMETKDPEKKDELWEEALDTLAKWKNCDISEMGGVNDRAALVCRVLHGEFGKDGFKELLKEGLIPRKIASKLVELISVRADELNKMEDANRGAGSLGWNHQTYADFLEKYSAQKDPA